MFSGKHVVAHNNHYFHDGDGAQYKDFIVDLVTGGDAKNIGLIYKRIFDPNLGTLRVAGFNYGDVGRNAIYKAISNLNGDSVKSYTMGAQKTMLPKTRLPNLVNIDAVTFQELYKNPDNPFTEHNIFSEIFDVATDTQLKTTIVSKDGTVIDTRHLSGGDLITAQILFDYMGNYDVM
ncbi:MAG: hypothetical protein Nk1A_8030 [Endomicrobiia bacterium]|nr:MAG: hypothetical protein Nk1A_8030 [Endomicrobiia bacterium]